MERLIPLRTSYSCFKEALKTKRCSLLLSSLLVIAIILPSQAQIQTTANISSSGTILYQPSPSNHFGVNVQYWNPAEVNAYYPDLWTLLNYIGAKYIVGATRRTWADEAASHGVKILFSFGKVWNTSDPMYESAYKDNATIKAHLDQYNISQYRNHPGVWGYDLAGEPWGQYRFDPRNPDEITMNLIKTLRFGLQYIKTLDPTHPVTLRLNTAGAHAVLPYPQWGISQTTIERRKAWINYFVDYVDFVMYDFYPAMRTGTYGVAGSEFYNNESGCRYYIKQQFDEVLIPASKGKPIIIGETGCPSAPIPEGASFNEAQQARFFQIFGEESRSRGIFVCVFKLMDELDADDKVGLFNPQNNGQMNIPKIAASRVKDYLSIP